MAAHIKQILTSTLTSPSITWRNDVLLTGPLLVYPLDGSNVCVPFILGGFSGITLYWTSVVSATHYILQICNNSSFSGPTIRTAIVAHPTVQYQLVYGTDIRIGETIFWRVFAVNTTTGGSSFKSVAWSLSYKCPQGIASNNSLTDAQKTALMAGVKYGATAVIGGPDNICCTGTKAWHLTISHNEKDEFGNAVSLTSVVWDLLDNGGGHTILISNNNICVIESDAYVSEVIILKVTVTLTVNSQTIRATDEKRIFVDCDGVCDINNFNGRVRFIIDSVDPYDPNSATATIQSRPCGITTVPEEVSGQITVVDAMGCLAFEVGMAGWASYMDSNAYPCRWEVDSLCCPS